MVDRKGQENVYSAQLFTIVANLLFGKTLQDTCKWIYYIITTFEQNNQITSESMINFFCQFCSLSLQNNDEFENHLQSEMHLIMEKKTESMDMDDSKDCEIYCVFCSKPFDSIDKIEIHMADEHTIEDNESNDFLTQTSIGEMKIENEVKYDKIDSGFVKISENKTNYNNYNNHNLILSDKLTVYDVDLNIVHIDATKFDQIKFCVRCNKHFDGEDNLRQHQLKDHAIRKRKRSSHPNGVEGIVVTGDGRWSCDVCGREFPTLKQAKVHKFKSHIEPIQKQELLSHDFMIRNNSFKETGNESIPSTINNNNSNSQYCPILPINNENCAPLLQYQKQISSNSGDNINNNNNVSPNSEVNSQRLTIESESENNSHIVDLSQSSSPTNINNPDCETIWKIKNLDSDDTKISLSKIQLKMESKQDINNANGAYNFSSRHFMCSHCPASFTSRAVYSRHILVHRRGKAFACDKCGMAFTRNHTLKQHKDLKCVVLNPLVGINCQATDQCLKCGTYFANSNSHSSHCKKVCKIAVYENRTIEEDSSKDSVKSEETNAQYDAQLEIDIGENDVTPMIINDFINNQAFVTKRINEFNCNLCCCYFASYKSIGHHLENYHRIQIRTNIPMKKLVENENLNVIHDFIHNCDECQSKYASKEALLKHKITHLSPQMENISPKPNVIIGFSNNYTKDKIKIETQLSPPQKMLCPTSFSLPNLMHSFSSEALNLSTSQTTLSNSTSIIYKSHSIKKSKVPPNANGEFECTECHKAFGCRSSLSNHVKSHYNLRNKPFPCEDCKQGFMSQISYQEHRKSQCPKLYGENASDRKVPISISSPSVQYNITNSSPSSATGRATCCMHCNAAFPDRSLLEDHASKEHSNESGEVICIMCTRSFTTYMAFRVHMTKSHGGPNGTPLKSHLTSTPNSQIKKPTSLSPNTSFADSPYSNFQLNYSFAPLVRHTCQNCKKDFETSQALGNHKRACGLNIVNEQTDQQ